jgi:hypothetical protein
VSKWRYIDPWSEDDPAIVRMREALALRPAISAQGRANDAGATSEVTRDADPASERATRRERVAALVRRPEAGDTSTVDALRRLLSSTH